MKLLFKSQLILFFLYAGLNAQIESVSFGGSVGFGTIHGNSPSVSSAGVNLFLDVVPWFSDGDVSLRAGFLYAQKIEKFLPENRTARYYPFIKQYSLKGFINQKISPFFYLEQGAGLIYLNDRTFGDVNIWEVGASFNVLAGLDWKDINNKGFALGLGLEYGITFTKTTAGYYLIYGQLQYYP